MDLRVEEGLAGLNAGGSPNFCATAAAQAAVASQSFARPRQRNPFLGRSSWLEGGPIATARDGASKASVPLA